MDKFLDKLGLFDLFSVLLPGVTFISFCSLMLYDFRELCIVSLVLSLFSQLVNTIQKLNMQVLIYFIFLAISYVFGFALRHIFVIIEKTPYIIDPREHYYTPLSSPNHTTSDILIDKVITFVASELGIKNPDEQWKHDNQRFVHQYCMTSLEVYGGVGKAERMSVLSEMSASFALIFSFLTVFYLFFSLISLFMSTLKPHVLFVIPIYAVFSFLFFNRYQRFFNFKVSTTLKSYYIKFIQPPISEKK